MRFDGFDAARPSGAMAVRVYGGRNEGVRPMELMLIALAGARLEVGNAMNKMHLPTRPSRSRPKADRARDPQVFTAIRVHYTVTGPEVTLQKFLKAFELGAVKYCSVANMMKQACEVAYSFTLNGETHTYPVAG
jgi:putative redox protein